MHSITTMTMQPKDIAQLQKRVQGWLNYAETEVKDPQLKKRFTTNLTLLRSTISKYLASADKQALYQIINLTRELEEAHEEARLRVGPVV